MTKITWKPGTMLAPVPPALISCGSVEKPNVMTAAWTGIISSEPPMTYVSIRPSRYSHELIKESGEFVINLTTLPLVSAADYCGVKSGRDIDKFKEMNLTAGACTEISAPQVVESPVSLECKVVSVANYGTHDMFLAEIVAVNVDDQFIDDNGRLNLEKAGLVAYSHGNYYTLGRNLGSFGFSVNKARLKQMQKMEKVKVEVIESKIKSEDDAKSDKKSFKTFEERKRSTTTSRNKKPTRRYEDDGERKPRSFNRDDRPRRSSDDSGERRPRRNFDDGERKPRSFNRDDRPRRSSEDSGERRPRRSFDDGERKPRSFNRDDRPRRSSEDSGERRPRRSFDDSERKPRSAERSERSVDKAPRKHYGKSKD